MHWVYWEDWVWTIAFLSLVRSFLSYVHCLSLTKLAQPAQGFDQ